MLFQFRNIATLILAVFAGVATLNAQSWTVENLYGGTIGDDQAFNLVSQANGNVTHIALTYSLGDPSTYPNVHIVQSDPLGKPVWEMVYDIQVVTPATANIPETEMSITEAQNGDFIWTTGVHASGGAEADIMICRIDPAGVVIWTRTLGANNLALDCATSVIEDPNTNEIYITGYSNAAPNAGLFDVVIAKLDANGGTVWQNQYGNTGTDRGRCIRLLSTGELVVAGETRSYSPTFNALQIAVNNAGGILWGQHYGLPNGVHEGFHSLIEHPNNYLYACGTRVQGGNYDVYVVESDPTLLGAEQNAAIYSAMNGGDERAWHITRSAVNGDLIMVGQVPESILGGNWDGFRLDISQTLAVTGYQVYGTPGDDFLRCIDYTPGNLVTGPTDVGYFMVGYQEFSDTQDEYLLRTNLVGKTDCYKPSNITDVSVSGDGTATLAPPSTFAAPAVYQLDQNPVLSYQEWCPGMYYAPYQTKSGLGLELSSNALALDLQISPQPISIGAEATLNFTLDSDAEIEIALLDMRGRQVFTLPYSAISGTNTVNIQPRGLSSGAYVLHLKGLAETATLNIILLD